MSRATRAIARAARCPSHPIRAPNDHSTIPRLNPRISRLKCIFTGQGLYLAPLHTNEGVVSDHGQRRSRNFSFNRLALSPYKRLPISFPNLVVVIVLKSFNHMIMVAEICPEGVQVVESWIMVIPGVQPQWPNDVGHPTAFQAFHHILNLLRPGVIRGTQEGHWRWISEPEQQVETGSRGVEKKLRRPRMLEYPFAPIVPRGIGKGCSARR